MNKKIFFLCHSMNVGGVEKALLSLLSIIPFDQYYVHLGLLHKKGVFLDDVPQQVYVHEIPCYDKYWDLINDPPLTNIKKMIKVGHLLEAFVHLLLYIQFKITSNRYWFYRYIMRHESKFPIAFDMAVSFAGPSQMMDYYVCKLVDAPIKVGWIHFDISKFGIDKGMTVQLYKQYQRIFVVSKTGKEIFDRIFPMFMDKTEVFHNIVPSKQVHNLADVGETFCDSFDGKRILTVGRISPEKGQREAIKAFKFICDKYSDIRWYFIGEGKDMENCKDDAERMGITDKVIFLGTKTNPYAFMRDCDIYMQPSRHEGFCITLAEALCFSNPIVSTDFTGAREQLKERKNSIVVGMEPEDIAKGVEVALQLPQSSDNCKEDSSSIQLMRLLSLFQRETKE